MYTEKRKLNKQKKSSRSILKNEFTDDDSLPKVSLQINLLEEEIPLYKIFVLEKVLCKSNSEARRLIEQGGAKLNGKKVDNFNYCATKKDILDHNIIYISAGIKRHAIIKII